MVVILPSNTWPGNALTLTCSSWPRRNAGLSASGTSASIHMELMSDTIYGAGGLAGCTNSPGAALRVVTLPVMGLGTMSVGSAVRPAMMRSMSASDLPNSRTESRAALRLPSAVCWSDVA